jgi:hypothetical protein
MSFAPNEIVQVTWYFAADAFRAAVTRFYRVTASTLGGPAEGAAAQRFITDYEGLFNPLLYNGAYLQGTTIYHTSEVPPVNIGQGIGLLGPGSAGAVPLPTGVSGLVRFSGFSPTKLRRGRIFVPFPALADHGSNANPTGSYVSRLDTLGARFLVASTASDTMPSPPFSTRTATFRATLWHGPFNANSLVTISKSATLWSSQRRRFIPPFVQFSPFG